MNPPGSFSRQILLVLLTALSLPSEDGSAELIRDRWGVPHVFAARESDGFYGVGYATAEDRILQMDLFRRRARGRLAELFGRDLLPSDRKFRIAGIGRYCDQAAANLPADLRESRAYARGDALSCEPEKVRRFAPFGLTPSDARRPRLCVVRRAEVFIALR
jgi:acyl-homoserine lactone acylase PvdQ